MRKCYSNNEEEFNFDDIEEAAQQSWDAESKVGDIITIWEGETLPFTASHFMPQMADAMTESAFDEGGDASDSWTFSRDEEKSLQDAVAKAVDAWAEKHDMQPKFYGVRNVKPIQVRFTDEDGGCEVIPANSDSATKKP